MVRREGKERKKGEVRGNSQEGRGWSGGQGEVRSNNGKGGAGRGVRGGL